MSFFRLSVIISGMVVLSGLAGPAPAWAQKGDKMVEQGDLSDTVKPYYDIYERNHGYVEDARDHRDRLDARRAGYVAPLISARAAGANAKGTESAAPPSQAMMELSTGKDAPEKKDTSGGLSEDDIRAFVSEVKDKTEHAMETGDVEVLNKLVQDTAVPSFTLTMKTEAYMDGKSAGSGTHVLTLGEILKSNKSIRDMSDVTFTYKILSIEITGDEATVKDESFVQAKVPFPGVGPVSSKTAAKCTDTLRRQPNGKLLYERSLCESRSDLNRDRPI